MRRLLLTCSVALFLCVPVAQADEPRTSAEASVDRPEVLVGDPIRYTVTCKHPAGVAIEWPSLGGTLEDLTVEASGTEPPQVVDGMTTEVRWYQLAGYSSGTHTIPETVLKYQTTDGASHGVQTQSVTVTVKSLLPSDWERQDIRDAKPLVPVRTAWWWVLGGLVAVAGVAGAWWWRRRHKRIEALSAVPRPPHELALEALSRLRQEDLCSRNRYEEYYVRLSGIVRTYIEARFGMKAPEMTTEEFLQAVSNAQTLSLDQRRLLQEFLERCDLVKFARYEPPRREADEAFEAAHRFVQDTAPSPEPAAVSAGKTA